MFLAYRKHHFEGVVCKRLYKGFFVVFFCIAWIAFGVCGDEECSLRDVSTFCACECFWRQTNATLEWFSQGLDSDPTKDEINVPIALGAFRDNSDPIRPDNTFMAVQLKDEHGNLFRAFVCVVSLFLFVRSFLCVFVCLFVCPVLTALFLLFS